MGNFRQHINYANSTGYNETKQMWRRQQLTDDGIPYSTPHLGPYFKSSDHSYGDSSPGYDVGYAKTAFPMIHNETSAWGNIGATRSSEWSSFNSDRFGFSMAVGNYTLVVGAPEHQGQYTVTPPINPFVEKTGPGKLYRWSLNYHWENNRIEPYNTHHYQDRPGSSYTVGIVAGIAGTALYSSSTSPSANNGNPGNTLQFGHSVAAACDRIAVGAPGTDGTSNTGTVKILQHLDIVSSSAYELGQVPGGMSAFGPWNFPPTTIKTLYGDASGDRYGHDVAIGCGKIVVGAPLADRGSANYNEGAAYIYDLDGNNPVKIGPEGSSHSNKRFGSAVAIGNGKVVVSRPEAEQVLIYDLDGNQTGVAELKFDSGTTYNYVYAAYRYGGPYTADDWDYTNGTAYIQRGVELGSEKWYAKKPGMLAVAQGRIAVGAIEQRGSSNPTYYDPIGAVYIYNLKGKLIKRIQAPDADVASRYSGTSFSNPANTPRAGRNFGRAVTIGMGFIFVGDDFYDETYNRIYWNHQGTNRYMWNPPVGKVYVFDLDGDFIGYIPNSDPNDQRYFGKSLAISEDSLFVASSAWTTQHGSESDGGVDYDYIGRSRIWRYELHNASYNIYDRIEMENGWLPHS